MIVCVMGCSASPQPSLVLAPKLVVVAVDPDLTCKLDTDCVWSPYLIAIKAEECECPGCPIAVVNHEGASRRKETYGRLCKLDGEILNNRRVCGTSHCIQRPNARCHQGRCVPTGSRYYDGGLLWRDR